MKDDPQRVSAARSPHSKPVVKILVSGCLNGPPIRFNQTSVEVRSPIWTRWVSEGRLVPFCAELAAGFQIPRPPAETVGGDGKAVLSGKATVLEDTGRDVTGLFTKGAELAVSHALDQGCVAAVLTDGSPSCGSTYVYDGSFEGVTNAGTGVVAQLLIDSGIRVFSEDQLEQADLFIRQPSV
jgi:uncharacterized protein YbbK (DUF523 family)